MNEDDAIEFDPDEPIDFEDKVAARAMAFTKLLIVVNGIKDKELRKEGLTMLSDIRRTFRTLRAAELFSIQGGKKDADNNTDL